MHADLRHSPSRFRYYPVTPLHDNKTNRTKTNRSGGIQGGISNGETIVLRTAFKPTSTISKLQSTVTVDGMLSSTLSTTPLFASEVAVLLCVGEETQLRGKGRHDPCVLPRAVPIVEAMVAVVLTDALMCHAAQCRLFPPGDSVRNILGKEIPQPKKL